ncbi:MAG TPA: undecaprenyl diphosphate synthase family protein [Allosphingosinicella sp.]|uniref:undecaprenyl diphosphate synthase family protein n=1 Tax=Allosphingosinicella sp. TaxID=2823234 RepID=UPI002F273644
MRHLGIIPDGGRRWARRSGVSLLDSYCLSMARLCEAAGTLFGAGVDEISIYLLSKANLRRSAAELDAISVAIGQLLEGMLQLGPSIAAAGDLSLVRPELRTAVERAAATPPKTDRRTNLCIAHDPIDEVNAARRASDGGDLFRYLWVRTSVDLVVRTGGAQTLSNFLPLQCAYARIVFRDELFNDLSVDGLVDSVRGHERREWLYGE